ncbi:MAG TPA: hypothetical protein VF516_03175 [Kofleriaceae bacterium]
MKAKIYSLGWFLAGAAVVGFAWISDSWIFADRLPSVRAKMKQASTAENPQVVILGSSRAAFGIAPKVLSRAWGLPDSAVVNVAFPGMTPSEIEEGWRIFEPKLKSAKLVIYCTDDYFLSDPPNRRSESLANEIPPVRKLGNVYDNIWAKFEKSEADLYSFDKNGLLHHPMNDVDRIHDERIFERVAASWKWKRDPEIELQIAAFGRRLEANGTKIVFVHLPMHSRERIALGDNGYRAGMERIAEELGTRFYYLDRPQDLGLTDESFVADPIHLRPREASIQTYQLAEVLKEQAANRRRATK